MSEKLKRCPFCFDKAVVHKVCDLNFYQVFCRKCKASSAMYGKRVDAVSAWNLRATDEVIMYLAKIVQEQKLELDDYRPAITQIFRQGFEI